MSSHRFTSRSARKRCSMRSTQHSGIADAAIVALYSRRSFVIEVASVERKTAGNARTGAIPTVFVVDDDISMRESLELLLESAGWQPVTFACAGDFLAHPKVAAPNCLVLDVGLPDMNG